MSNESFTSADDHGGHDHPHGHHHPTGLRGGIKEIFAPHSHDAADSIDGALESSAAGIRAVKISLLILGLTAIVQIAIVVISGSVALAADSIHNVSDALTAVPLWIAFALGTKAATRRYTYGFGRVEDLAGLFVIAMITLSAIVAGYEAVMRSSILSRLTPWLGRRGWSGRVHRQRVGGPLPHRNRAPHWLSRPGGRWSACAHRRVYLAGGAVLRRRCRARISIG